MQLATFVFLCSVVLVLFILYLREFPLGLHVHRLIARKVLSTCLYAPLLSLWNQLLEAADTSGSSYRRNYLRSRMGNASEEYELTRTEDVTSPRYA
jgi:hypothetical protein